MSHYKAHYLENGKMLLAKVAEKPIDCRSEIGITIGLIDSIITCARLLVKRDLSDPAVIEALNDIRSDEDVGLIIARASEGTE